jgi:hypothetical protein
MSICPRPLAGVTSRRLVVSSLQALISCGALALVVQSTASAHHSFTATYFEDRTVTIEGRVLQFQFRNPHSFVHIQAPGEDGEMYRWAVEWGGSSQLSNQGLASATLRPGDVVQITGNPGRDPDDHRVRMRYLFRPADGFDWGNEPGETFD